MLILINNWHILEGPVGPIEEEFRTLHEQYAALQQLCASRTNEVLC